MVRHYYDDGGPLIHLWDAMPPLACWPAQPDSTPVPPAFQTWFQRTPSSPAVCGHVLLGWLDCFAPFCAAGVIPADPKQPFDVRAVLARLLDGSRFHEFKAQVRPQRAQDV